MFDFTPLQYFRETEEIRIAPTSVISIKCDKLAYVQMEQWSYTGENHCFPLPLNFQVFLKIDKFGNGLEIDQARLGNCKQLGNVFTEEKFRYMCILSGCDYLPSIHGIGLVKACKLLKLANNPDIIKVILL